MTTITNLFEPGTDVYLNSSKIRVTICQVSIASKGYTRYEVVTITDERKQFWVEEWELEKVTETRTFQIGF